MDFISLIIFVGIIQGFLVGFLLLTINRGNKKANRLLGLLLITASFSIIGFELDRTDTHKIFPFLIGLPQTVVFLLGPLFYYYVNSLTTKNFLITKKELLHLIPFFAVILYRIPLFILSNETKLEYVSDISRRDEELGLLILQCIHLFIYLHITIKNLREYTAAIKTTMSSLEKINLNWIRLCIHAFVIIFVVMFNMSILYFAGIHLYEYYSVIIPILVSITILVMGYLGFKQPIIFPPEVQELKIKKYERSSLTIDKADLHLQELLAVMGDKKPYLDNELTLAKLSEMLSIPQHHLSQVLNEKLNQNFFDFVNNYRIQEAKKLLVSPEGGLLTILAIAEEVGFNSKSAFNNAFKKVTNTTPSEFRKSNS